MNAFDRRWLECVARARSAPVRPAQVPLGFAARVLAEVRASVRGPTPLMLWERLGIRALAGVLALLLVLGALEYRDRERPGLPSPGIERSVGQAFWML